MEKQKILLLGCGLFLTLASQLKAAQDKRPNVIVILTDDLGSSDIGFGGCKDILTPNIDKIANQGVNCTNAYISATYSGPSRCGIMTGRYQQRFDAEGNPMSMNISIAEKQGVPTNVQWENY